MAEVERGREVERERGSRKGEQRWSEVGGEGEERHMRGITGGGDEDRWKEAERWEG